MDLNNLVLEKIKFGEELINSTLSFNSLEGLSKLHRKIRQELSFLKKIYRQQSIKKEHLQCSNLTHFSALVNTLKKVTNCISVNKVFSLNDRKITVDIVSNDGLTWMKVVARNPKSLSQICMGDTSYGVRSIVDQAKEFADCAKLYPCLFQIPTIIFVFVNGINSNLAMKIESYGVQVQGEKLEERDHYEDIDDDRQNDFNGVVANLTTLSTNNAINISKVNLDVSAMLAYCSSVTNGSAGKYTFSVPILAQQAEWELERPQKPILDEFFTGKQLYCCKTAKDNFVNIVNTVGGPTEKSRAEEFLERITVLPDDATVEDTDENVIAKELFNNVQYNIDKGLNVGGKIRERSLIIFTFGDRIQAATVTANEGFIRAAKQQGINFVVFLHESRALTEQKEQSKGNVI